MALPANVEMMFGGAHGTPKLPATEVSQRFDELMKAVSLAPTRAVSREEIVASHHEGRPIDFSDQPSSVYSALTRTLNAPEITKGLSADALASVTLALDQLKSTQPDLVKDLTLTNPLATGLVAFDLEAPAKVLAPRPTPLRNRFLRNRGYGTSHRYKVISGYTGTGTGGVNNIHPGIVDTTQTNFAPTGASQSLYYARGPKMAYAGYDSVVPYSQFSLSDEVTWSAQYAGQGYQDIRQLSRTSLLYASMLMEERMLLMGRGTQAGFSGAMPAPTGVTVVPQTPTGGNTAITGMTTNVYVRVTSDAGAFGESVTSTVVSPGTAPTGIQDVLVKCADVSQALGYNVYIGTGASDPGLAGSYYAGRFTAGTAGLEVGGALPIAGRLAPVADTSAYAAGYDGILAYCLGPNSGYNKKIDSTFSNTNPGVEFQNAFVALYNTVKADPDRILFNGADRKQLSDTLKGSSSSNYQLKITQDELAGVTLGDVAVAVINEVTGKRVEMEVHPWMPQGVAPIISDTLPIPDTQVSNVWAVINVQDYMGVDWPVLQFAYESSSYWFGTAVCYAPAWNGAVSGIVAA